MGIFFLKPLQKLTRKGRVTRANKGQVTISELSPANDAVQHIQNAFLRYITRKKTIKVSPATYEKIMRTFELGNEDLLMVFLDVRR